jgi:type IV fimbrial biogenesis protein FimT
MVRRARGFTLIEALVTLTVIAVLLGLIAPSFSKYLLVQRIKSVNAELVTDMNMARSTAVSRNVVSRVVFRQNSTITCYTVFTSPIGAANSQRCDCTEAIGTTCTNSNADASLRSQEIKTVQILRSTGVTISAENNVLPGINPTPAMGFNNSTGGLLGIPNDLTLPTINDFNIEVIGSSNMLLRTKLSAAGRPTICSIGDALGGTPC